MDELVGGTHTVERIGDRIRRPAGPHTPTVHRLLAHLRRSGLTETPKPLEYDPVNEREVLSFVPGSTTNYPLRGIYQSTRALESAARLLRKFHDATLDFELHSSDHWYLPAVEPVEVICHGDFAPYNCAFATDGSVTGVFDFDTAHPGPRAIDIGYAAYRWVPITTSPENEIRPRQQGKRLLRFCEAYGTDDIGSVIEGAIASLQDLIAFMREQARAGHASFAAHLEAGHDQLYLADIDHLRTFRPV